MAVEAVKNYSVGFQQPHKMNLKSQQSFTAAPEVDKEKSNATKYMIGATALAAVVGLGIVCYKGKLGKGIQKFLGGAENATKKEEEVINDVLRKTKMYIVDGKPYTGGRNTPKAKITYVDGYIISSKLADGTVKYYDGNKNGCVYHVFIKKPNGYTLSINKLPDGNILRVQSKK